MGQWLVRTSIMAKYILTPHTPEPQKFAIDYRGELNDEQYAVVTHGAGPCLVLAGAGSGKTRALVFRVAYLLERGIKPDRILLMTFTNKAAKEMLHRIELLLKVKPDGLWGGTFHHVGNRLLRMYGKQIGIEPGFVILDQEDSRDLVKACMAELDVGRDKYFPRAELIHKMISLAANLNQSLTQVIVDRFAYIDEEIVPKIVEIATAYRDKKRSANQLDYDDLLVRWFELLAQRSELREKLAEKFQYILVDEYQDTNPIQGEIIKQLAGPKANILVVGDDAQAIYSFRGATIENILQFPKMFPSAEVCKLESNYRSTPEILTLANATIKKNQHQFEKKLHTTRPSAGKPMVVGLYDLRQQADFVGQKILELQRDEGVSLSDIAILFRAHYQSLELELGLNSRNIPYVMRGGVRFFEQAHIKDVIAYVKAAANIQDELSWLRVLRLQTGVGDVTARRIWQILATQTDLASALTVSALGDLPNKARAGWNDAKRTFEQLLVVADDDVAGRLSVILKSGYSQYALASFENAQDRVEDLKQLVNFAANYKTVEKFLADVALSEGFSGESIVGYEDGPDEALTLSTIHQAKGLEWKVVFVVGLADGQFPYSKASEGAEQLEEERRLFYVAVTRAQDELFLTYPTVAGRGDLIARPSQFLRELPEATFTRLEVQEAALGDGNTDDDSISFDDEGNTSILDFYLGKKSRS
jgi:DNA helicase-2/ATP-dependent DNA helicase PcrA